MEDLKKESVNIQNFKKDLIKHRRRLAKKMITYIKFLEDNGQCTKDAREKIDSVFLCRDVCAKKWAE